MASRIRRGRRNFCEAVQPRVEGPHEPGAVLGAGDGAIQWYGQASGGFAQDDFGEGAAAVVLRQGGGVAPDIGGHRAGVARQLEDDLLVVARFEVRVGRVWVRSWAPPPLLGASVTFDATEVAGPSSTKLRRIADVHSRASIAARMRARAPSPHTAISARPANAFA